MDIVDFSSVEKQLRRVPKDIIKRLQRGAVYVETTGLVETRKVPDFHDEPLKGRWKGCRSVRLGHKWRVIYKYNKGNEENVIELREVTAHEY